MQIIPLEYKNNSKIRVAAYARVSTKTEKQKESYKSQVEYYTALIKSNSDWEFTRIYADRGKSGANSENRPNFMRMIADAKAGKFDLILVKSVSRFARNSLEAQEYARILKEYNVEVRFEKENISTFEPRAEMMFNIWTIIAEEESRSIRENTLWSYKHLAEKGIRHLGNRILGYDEIDGVLTPNSQAWIPELIFNRYAEGKSCTEIADELGETEVNKKEKKVNISRSRVSSILRNEIYVGDRIIQKASHVDWKTKKPNWGEAYESYYIENDHEGIISRELWNKVQVKINSKSRGGNRGRSEITKNAFGM